jgi:hypothetical protein
LLKCISKRHKQLRRFNDWAYSPGRKVTFISVSKNCHPLREFYLNLSIFSIIEPA